MTETNECAIISVPTCTSKRADFHSKCNTGIIDYIAPLGRCLISVQVGAFAEISNSAGRFCCRKESAKMSYFPCRNCGNLTKSKYGYCQKTQECKNALQRELRKTDHGKQCAKIYNSQRLEQSYDSVHDWVKRKMSGWKHGAKKRNVEFDLTFDDIPLTDYCPVTGIEFILETVGNVGEWNPHSPSLDRINPNYGYVPGNVRLVAQIYNIAKGSLEHYDNVDLIIDCLLRDRNNWVSDSEYQERSLETRRAMTRTDDNATQKTNVKQFRFNYAK